MAVLAVVSDSPGAGKTAFCSALVRLARDRGKTAAVYKPVGPAEDPDAAAYEKLLGQRMNGASRLTEGEAVGEAPFPAYRRRPGRWPSTTTWSS